MSRRPATCFKTLCHGFMAVAMMLGLSFTALSAQAQQECIPGRPCIVPFTPNDPFVMPISPNVSPAPNAPKNTSNVCDADFMNQIYGNAVLEARRETLSAEAIMKKPDSVLEYTCFDQLASRNALYAPNSFSSPTNGLVPLTEMLVLQGLKSYIDKNFWHTFLGGASPDDSSISASVTGGSYTCPYMNEVFMLAKCDDFSLDAPFMTFKELINYDPRRLPRACTSGTKITQDLIDLANNKNWEYASFDKIDPVQSGRSRVIELLRSGKTSSSCAKPIPTGIMVQNVEKDTDILGREVTISGSDYTYEDKVCPNPACSFDNKKNANGADDACVPLLSSPPSQPSNP